MGHFVSSPREREKKDRRDSRGDEREGQGRKRNRNESEEQGSRGRRILRPRTHKSGSGLLKIPKAESAGRMFFSRGTTTNYDRLFV